MMAGGAPIPVLTEEMDRRVVCVEDLKEAGSKNMAPGVRGETLTHYTPYSGRLVHEKEDQ